MQFEADSSFYQLEQDQKPNWFDATGGGRRTSADKKQQEQHHLAENRPDSEIRTGETGGGNDGNDLENAVSECIKNRINNSKSFQGDHDDNCSDCDNQEIQFEFPIPDKCGETPAKSHEIQKVAGT